MRENELQKGKERGRDVDETAAASHLLMKNVTTKRRRSGVNPKHGCDSSGTRHGACSSCRTGNDRAPKDRTSRTGWGGCREWSGRTNSDGGGDVTRY